MATYPGKPPNPLGVKVEINLNGTFTDITQFVMLRDLIQISGFGRADESSTITASTLTLTLKNDGRFTPKNSAGAYFPNLTRNIQIRVSVNATSTTGVAYNDFRFFGEVSSWPPSFDESQRDKFVQITASGIWKRIQQANVPIGSAYTRYVKLLTGSGVPQAYWSMEDGNNTSGWVLTEGTGTNMGFTSNPSFAANGTDFPGSDAIPQFNGARITGNISGGTPTNNVLRFALSVPATGDSGLTSGSAAVINFQTGGTIKTVNVTLDTTWKLTITARNVSNAVLFSTQLNQALNGTPVIVSIEFTPSGGNVAWAMKVIKPGAGSVLASISGTVTTASVGAVTFVTLNGNGILADTSAGQMVVWYASVPTITNDASAINGWAGETTVTRFQRICGESNVAATVVGSSSVTMGPQVDDTLANILQGIEDTECGLLSETRGQLGLTFRTLASMQNQAAAVTVPYTSNVLGAVPEPTYDDALARNQWTVTNSDGYAALALITVGAMSTAAPPNGIGPGYSASKNVNAGTHAQVNAIAQQLLFQGATDEVRYPTLTFNFQRSQAAPFFSSIPSLKLGDRLDVTSLPAFLGGGSTKQLIWGYTETIGGETQNWTIVFNTIPEVPFETSFSPGTFSVAQAPSGSVAAGASVGSTVSGAQIPNLPSSSINQTLVARSFGGITQFISAATPFNWTFTVSGTPADVTYFICTASQAQNIAVGDTFSNSGGHGGPFTVTGLQAASGGNVQVYFTPDASSVMSTGTVTGGKNGDTWVNTSGGNQLNQWVNGSWSPVTWNATNVIQAGTITATQIQAGTITATQIASGIVIAGIVDGTVIIGALVETAATNPSVQLDGARDAIFGYDGSSNLLFSLAGASGTDFFGHSYPQGLMSNQLTLPNQASAPPAVTGASSFYSSTAGRPRYLSQVGTDAVLERSVVNVSQFTCGNTTTPTVVSAALNYLANEGAQSSEFEIEIDGVATTANSGSPQTLSFGLAVDGTILGGAFTIGAVFLPVGNKTFSYTIRFRLWVLTTGAGGTVGITTDGQMAAQGVNAGSTTSPVPTIALGAQSQPTTKSMDTTTTHTLDVRANWGATNAGQTLTTYRTKVGRRM